MSKGSASTHGITVSGIEVEIVRKDIKNLHLGVYPPGGRVRVAAPLHVGDEAVRLAVVGKLGWIKRQQAGFEAQPRQSKREMVGGESHYYLGQRYRMQLVLGRGATRIELSGSGILEVHARPEATAEQRARALETWHRERVRDLAAPLMEKWQTALEVEAEGWGIRKMKTRWGSCNIERRFIWLNLELVKKPVECLEYLIVHELAHLIERRHNDRFTAILDSHLPLWRHHRQVLNSAPLAQEAWGY